MVMSTEGPKVDDAEIISVGLAYNSTVSPRGKILT